MQNVQIRLFSHELSLFRSGTSHEAFFFQFEHRRSGFYSLWFIAKIPQNQLFGWIKSAARKRACQCERKGRKKRLQHEVFASLLWTELEKKNSDNCSVRVEVFWTGHYYGLPEAEEKTQVIKDCPRSYDRLPLSEEAAFLWWIKVRKVKAFRTT